MASAKLRGTQGTPCRGRRVPRNLHTFILLNTPSTQAAFRGDGTLPGAWARCHLCGWARRTATVSTQGSSLILWMQTLDFLKKPTPLSPKQGQKPIPMCNHISSCFQGAPTGQRLHRPGQGGTPNPVCRREAPADVHLPLEVGGEGRIRPRVPEPQAARQGGMLGDLLPGRRHGAAGDQAQSHLLFPRGVRDVCQGLRWAQGGPGSSCQPWHQAQTSTGGCSQKPALPRLAECARCMGWERKPSQGAPRAARTVHDATGMGWTSGTGATFHPGRVEWGEGTCPGLGEDIGPCSLGTGMELTAGSRPLARSRALTLRWSSWACGPPLPSIS